MVLREGTTITRKCLNSCSTNWTNCAHRRTKVCFLCTGRKSVDRGPNSWIDCFYRKRARSMVPVYPTLHGKRGIINVGSDCTWQKITNFKAQGHKGYSQRTFFAKAGRPTDMLPVREHTPGKREFTKFNHKSLIEAPWLGGGTYNQRKA